MIRTRSKPAVSKGPCGSGEERARVARRQTARRVAVFRELDRLPVGVRPAVASKLRLAQAAACLPQQCEAPWVMIKNKGPAGG